MPIISFQGHTPKIADGVFIAPNAYVIGDVTLEENVSVFFGVVIRGDILPIKVGAGTNIQEHSMLHTSHGMTPCIVGKNVTVGHGAIIHGCTVENGALVGMGATLLDQAIIGEESAVGAQSLVTMGKKIPPRSLAMGVPAKVVRELDEKDIQGIKQNCLHYVDYGRKYRAALSSS